MKIFTSLVATLFLSITAFAQSNYQPAYLIGLKGDTIHGYINYREWNSNPESIEFKTALADKDKQKITPGNVLGFSVTGSATYLTYSGPISIDEVGSNKISNSRDTSFKVAEVFLKVLQKGENVTLYNYQDNIKIRYFISEGVQAPKELVYHVYYSSERLQSGTVTESTYKKQLSAIAAKHGLLDDKLNLYIQRTEYNYSNILSVISKLNGIKVAKEDNDIASANYFYAGVGANITSFKVGGEYENAGGTPYTSVMPKILAGINFFANSNTQKVAFRVELGIGANRYRSDYKNKVSPYNDVTFHFTQIAYSISPQIIYNIYNQPDLKFYAAAGMQTSLFQYFDKTFRNQDGSAFSSFQGIPFYFNTLFNSAMFKLGFTINKKIDVYVDYLTANDLNKDPYFVLTSTSVQAGVNYSFK